MREPALPVHFLSPQCDTWGSFIFGFPNTPQPGRRVEKKRIDART